MSVAAAGAGRVSREYSHSAKEARPAPLLPLDCALLKWYDLAPADAPVPRDVRQTARADLFAASRSGALGLEDDIGFAILHRCGESFYFLLICTWRNDNELWETVWAKASHEEIGFGPWHVAQRHHPTFCVWELGVVCHEQRAWATYLRSARDAAAKDAYLASVYEGAV